MDPVGACLERTTAELDVIVLADRKDGPTGCVGARDGIDAVVGAGGEVDDHPVDVGQDAIQAGG